jgi:hypothetical protein
VGVVANTYNPSYFGSRDWEDHDVRLARGNSIMTSISTSKPGMVAHACNPSYTGGIGRRTDFFFVLNLY